MTADKYKSLQSYLDNLKVNLAAKDVPPKHRDSAEAYRDYLRLEIRRTELRLETDPVVEPKSK